MFLVNFDMVRSKASADNLNALSFHHTTLNNITSCTQDEKTDTVARIGLSLFKKKNGSLSPRPSNHQLQITCKRR
jgi:hypothetical protein